MERQSIFTDACEYRDIDGGLWQLPTPSKENGYSYPAMREVILNIAEKVLTNNVFDQLVEFGDTGEFLWFTCRKHHFSLQTLDGHTYYRIDRSRISGSLDNELPESKYIGLHGMIVTSHKKADGQIWHHPNFYARATFPYIVDYFDHLHPDEPITLFKGQWVNLEDGSFGDNFHAFHQYLKENGLPSDRENILEAAKHTPSGKMALHAGFDKQVIVNDAGAEVIAYFLK